MERRERYRARVDGAVKVQARIELDDREIAFSVVNMTSGGAAIMVPPHEDPGLTVGQSVRCTFECSSLAYPIRVEARVVHIQDEVLFRVCGLAFQLDLAGRDVPKDVRELFNRRRNVRAEPDPTQPVAVDVALPDGTAVGTGRLLDVTESGLGFSLPSECALETGGHVHVSFRLDTSELPLRFLVHVCHAEEADGRRTFGAEFDDDAASEADEERRLAVVAFVIRRQQQLASAL